MKQFLLFPIIALCISLFSEKAYSQGYRPGFIVSAEGDTTQGLVRFRENDRNYKSCLFKASEESEAREYEPDELLAYGITNDALFESKNIVDAKGKSTNAFVEAIIHGSLSLYQHKSLFYLEKDKGDLKPVLVETGETSVDGAVVARTSIQHLILINSLTFDCPVPESLLAKVQKNINAADIVAVVQAYNNCIKPNSSISYKEEKPWMTTEKGILIGLHSTSLNFKAGPYSIKDAEFPNANNLIIGGYINVISPRKSERISFHLEPFYSREKHLGYLELQGPLLSLKNDYTIDIHRLSVLSMARYTIAKFNTLSPYFGIGMSSNLVFSGKGTRRLETETLVNDIRNIETSISESDLDRKFFIGATAALGTAYTFNAQHKVLLQLRYEQGRYVSGKAINDPDFTAHLDNNHSFYVTAAYILK